LQFVCTLVFQLEFYKVFDPLWSQRPALQQEEQELLEENTQQKQKRCELSEGTQTKLTFL
jgi:hypothetical protein